MRIASTIRSGPATRGLLALAALGFVAAAPCAGCVAGRAGPPAALCRPLPPPAQGGPLAAAPRWGCLCRVGRPEPDRGDPDLPLMVRHGAAGLTGAEFGALLRARDAACAEPAGEAPAPDATELLDRQRRRGAGR